MADAPQLDFRKKSIALIPAIGVLIFICLYFVAANLYDGGNAVNPTEPGFSLTRNYWCNLLNENCLNGQPNRGRSFALAGMLVLALTMSGFWWINAKHLPLTPKQSKGMLWSGIPAAAVMIFIFTGYHDQVINLSGLMAIPAFYFLMVGLRKKGWHGMTAWGMMNIALVLLNNFLYYTPGFLIYLPVVQKISFLSFLLWFAFVSIQHYYKQNLTNQTS